MIDITAHRNSLPSARLFIDARWPAVAAAIQHLCAARRRSLRMVDAECGDGRLLLQAARYARAMGFTAIEARGIDADPTAIRGARAAAAALRDPAIGLVFEATDLLTALAEEAEFPADILLWAGGAGSRPHIADAAAAAGRIVIGGAAPRLPQRAAA
ncbi:SAM-dependent methyltransferase [Sphingopyxis sp.]|uniref:SAM-dependent methyltransferase n=1 Tax=Sphingopyxis sp. TaxID=1908224 RepID=UPI003F7259FD